MAEKESSSLIPYPRAAVGTAPGSDHPCEGCVHFYGAYRYNRCCNYLFDTGNRRPCPAGEECTVRHDITCKEDLRLRKATPFY